MTSFNAVDFCHYIYQYGLELDPSKVKIDGKPHNCKMIDNAPGKLAGSYTVYPNTGIAIFKSWRDGIIHKYYPSGSMLPKTDIKKIMQESKQKQYEEWFQVSQASYKKFNAIPATGQKSEYLAQKFITNNIASYDVKVDPSGNLIIPFKNRKGFISTLQTILPEGSKYFEKGGQISGCFHQIGFKKVEAYNYSDEIYIGEGFATMASVYMAIGKPCIAAANCGNLLPVLDNVAKLYPHAKYVICADNDIALREIPVGSGQMIWSNPGIEAAINCQNLHACDVVIPDFAQVKVINSFTDFNDLHVALGIDEVKLQIMSQLKPSKRQSLVKLVFTLVEYENSEFKDKLLAIRNYFIHFGQSINSELTSNFIDGLQVDIKVYDDFTITNLFYDFTLSLVEQIHSEEVIIKYDEIYFRKFEKLLGEIKLSQMIEIDQRLNALSAELLLLKENRLNNNLLEDYHE